MGEEESNDSGFSGAGLEGIPDALTAATQGSYNIYENGASTEGAKAFGTQKGRTIGKGVGMAAGSLFGPVGTIAGGAIGGLIGGAIGGNRSAQRSKAYFQNQRARRTNFVNIYEGIARQNKIDSAMSTGQAYIDDRYRLNLPSL